jgi:hypothetical protein
LLHHYSHEGTNRDATTSAGGSFQKPSKTDYGEPFTVKIQHLQQGGDDILWIYNKERDCEFFLYYDQNAHTYKNDKYSGRHHRDNGISTNGILQKSTINNSNHDNNSKNCIGYNDLIDKIQHIQQHQKCFSNNEHHGLSSSTASNSNNASMHISAVFENEQCCKLFIHQTKIKLWWMAPPLDDSFLIAAMALQAQTGKRTKVRCGDTHQERSLPTNYFKLLRSWI